MDTQEKLTSENIALLQKMIRELNWSIVMLLIISVTTGVFLFYTNISNKITSIILVNLGFIPICFLFVKEKKAVKQDIKNGFKSIINGIITDMVSARGRTSVYIGKVGYIVPQRQRMNFNIGDDIQIELLPTCKHVIKISKIEE